MSKDLICPECGKVAEFYLSPFNDVLPQTVIKCGCGKELVWGRVWWARFLFALWVRREAKRRNER